MELQWDEIDFENKVVYVRHNAVIWEKSPPISEKNESDNRTAWFAAPQDFGNMAFATKKYDRIVMKFHKPYRRQWNGNVFTCPSWFLLLPTLDFSSKPCACLEKAKTLLKEVSCVCPEMARNGQRLKRRWPQLSVL